MRPCFWILFAHLHTGGIHSRSFGRGARPVVSRARESSLESLLWNRCIPHLHIRKYTKKYTRTRHQKYIKYSHTHTVTHTQILYIRNRAIEYCWNRPEIYFDAGWVFFIFIFISIFRMFPDDQPWIYNEIITRAQCSNKRYEKSRRWPPPVKFNLSSCGNPSQIRTWFTNFRGRGPW